MKPHPASTVGKVLFLTKYSRQGASSRFRTYQYLPLLEAAGLSCDVAPLFDDAYLARRYGNGRGASIDFIKALWRRLCALLHATRYDRVVIEYELLPYFPPLFERLLSRLGVRYLVEYDDAIFHKYDLSRQPLVRVMLKRKIATVMRLADAVIAGNDYLADYAQRAGARQVAVLPTVIDLDRYPPRPWPAAQTRLVIGWLGSPSTGRYLEAIAPALARVCADGRARLRLVGPGPIDLPGVAAEIVAWSEASETAQLHGFDIGIMPLPDDPWARGKCGFKLIQYMACGLPVVASPVGVNQQIVEHGGNGFLAATEEEWVGALTALLDDAALRERMGRAGRVRVEQRYCLQKTGPELAALLQH